MLKTSLKRTLSAGLRSVGSTGLLDPARPWIERRLVPKLLDAGALPAEPKLVRLRSSPGRVLSGTPVMEAAPPSPSPS